MKLLTSYGCTWKVDKSMHNLIKVAEGSLEASALHGGKGGHTQHS